MGVIKLKSACKDYIWGGDKLKREYGIISDKEILAEAWVLSCHPDGLCTIDGGENDGLALRDYIEHKGSGVTGKNTERFKTFPLMVKLIDAKNDLSIQVHPDNDYALKNDSDNGKTEYWYILDSEPDAYIYYGLKKSISKEEFRERIENNSLIEVLNKVPVKKGDGFLISPGTLHAIGRGTVLAEVQQNSNITYRVYDYGRKGADGKLRELHIDKALDVTKLEKPENSSINGNCLITSPYFKTDRYFITAEKTAFKINVDNSSFKHILVLSGDGSLSVQDESLDLKKGGSFFVTAGTGEVTITGTAEILITSCP